MSLYRAAYLAVLLSLIVRERIIDSLVNHYTIFTIKNLRTDYETVRMCHLRVLLDKPPDIVTPTVGGKFLFGYIINSTYPGGLPKVKSLDLGACTVLWGLDQVI